MVLHDGTAVAVESDWNTSGGKLVETFRVPHKLEMRLAISDKNMSFVASNGGFLICEDPEPIVPLLMPQSVGGEVNFFPGVVDLNVSRDSLVENAATKEIRSLVGDGIKRLLLRASAERPKEIRSVTRDVLMVYLERSSEHEQIGSRVGRQISAQFTPKPVNEVPPLTSAEAAELLIDSWFIRMGERELSFRDALRQMSESGENRVYWSRRYMEKPIVLLFKENLARRGFLVITIEANRVWFRGGNSVLNDYESVLKILAKRYEFDLRSVEEPWPGDISSLLVPFEQLSPIVRSVIREIKRTRENKILIGRLRDAPAAFNLARVDYLNLDNEIFNNVNAAASSYDVKTLKAYILGLLQFELE